MNDDLEDISIEFEVAAPRLLFVASTGGHLEQLYRVYQASTASNKSVWVTFDSPQSTSLLKDVDHHFVRDVGPRDWVSAVRVFPSVLALLWSGSFDGVVSTGAAISVPSFLAARILRIRTLYIESVSRTDGPSLSGRVVQGSLLASKAWAQHRKWLHGRWQYHGNVLGQYQKSARPATSEPMTIFVTLGTLADFRFDALIERLRKVVPDNAQLVWQTGCTSGFELDGEQYDYVSAGQFDRYATDSDVVVSHAGVGSVLRLLGLGVYPILVPRRVQRNEQVDDHQLQIARMMSEKGLALVREVDDLSTEDLESAAGLRVVPASDAR